jgi:FdrA protein
MQLQRALTGLPGVLDAGVVMGTQANKKILEQSGLLTHEALEAAADDLVILVRASDAAACEAALAQVDVLLLQRRSAAEQDYQPKSLESAAQALPSARWLLVSVPGRYAGAVARDGLRLGKHVFLYSDNVPMAEEVELKQAAAQGGLLVMGPDCGTAIVNGIGLGFANVVRRGPIGLVAASGTGLQEVASRIHQLGGGISHALGTGGRDLSEAVHAVTARQSLDLLGRDPQTRVIVLVSKPPAPAVADTLLHAARQLNKPIVVDFIGYPRAVRRLDHIYFAGTLDETAEWAVRLAADQGHGSSDQSPAESETAAGSFASGQRYLRGLFSGGTLAYEALLLLQDYLPVVYSNAPLRKEHRLASSMVSQAHSIIDLGEDEFTVGRLHPMMDNDLRIRRLQQEAQDPEVALILMDVVLGFGAHPEPASELAPAIATARAGAESEGRLLEVVLAVVGTDQDPQNMANQMGRLEAAGARVMNSNLTAVLYAGRRLQALDRITPDANFRPVELSALHQPLAAINVGLTSFSESLESQGAPVVQVDWHPPAGGNERLAAILERMKRK